MILIFSQNKLEASTNDVIDWLEYYNEPYYRINGDDIKTNDYYLEVHKDGNQILDLEFSPKNINAVWFRRWDSYSNFKPFKIDRDVDFENSLNKYLYSEYIGLSFALFNMFNKSYWLSNPSNRIQEDKILALRQAETCGLVIPKTFITTSKKKLVNIIEKEASELITKSIFNVTKIIANKERYVQYTQVINKSNLNKIPETFFPSLFQEQIEKEYEIRVFYLEGEIYSMAIFSQLDNQTEVDFRKYNFEKPNRNIPYKLPLIIEKKIKKLMTLLGLNTGSIDLIKDVFGRYVFLEINPAGQFGMVSLPCNYNLEKKIAKLLINKNEKNK